MDEPATARIRMSFHRQQEKTTQQFNHQQPCHYTPEDRREHRDQAVESYGAQADTIKQQRR